VAPPWAHRPRASYAIEWDRNVNATHLPAEPSRYEGTRRPGRCRAPQEEGGGDGDIRPEEGPPDGGRHGGTALLRRGLGP